jgi:hypothetical protein
MDIDSNPIGVDYRSHIDDSLQRCDMLLAVIGRQWLGTGPVGARRIDDPSDLVRLEVTRALARGIRVVPLLIDETEMPSLEELPEDLKGLKFRQAFRVDSGVDFHHHLDRLCAAIEAASPRPAKGTDSVTPIPPKPPAAGSRPNESAASLARQSEEPRVSELARAALICSTLGPVLAYFVILGLHEGIPLFTFVLFVVSGAAIVCGHLARKHIRRNPSLSGKPLALAGLIVGYVLLFAVTLLTIAIIHDSMR